MRAGREVVIMTETVKGHFRVTHDQYRALKRMNRTELEEFLWQVYSQGIRQGIETTAAAAVNAVGKETP